MSNIDKNKYIPSETALIILGDSGINFFLNKTDAKNKKALQNTGYTFIIVRGNHELPPARLPKIESIYNEEVKGEVWIESKYPNIIYLKDGGVYWINGLRTLVLGGAYSVDKYYRLGRALHLTENDEYYKIAKTVGWFKDEQLSKAKMEDIEDKFTGHSFDLVLSHTCPYDWEPTDLFLSVVNQSQVDNSMELWMNDFKSKIYWNIWLFGHFHDNRLIRPHVEMLFADVEELNNITNRWNNNLVDWWLKKDPKYYME